MVGQKLDYACLLYPICGSEIQNFEAKDEQGHGDCQSNK
jgi:hypothetical protein